MLIHLLSHLFLIHPPVIYCTVKAHQVVTLVCDGLGSCHYVYKVVYLISCS
jgi:hypothetical protein